MTNFNFSIAWSREQQEEDADKTIDSRHVEHYEQQDLIKVRSQAEKFLTDIAEHVTFVAAYTVGRGMHGVYVHEDQKKQGHGLPISDFEWIRNYMKDKKRLFIEEEQSFIPKCQWPVFQSDQKSSAGETPFFVFSDEQEYKDWGANTSLNSSPRQDSSLERRFIPEPLKPGDALPEFSALPKFSSLQFWGPKDTKKVFNHVTVDSAKSGSDWQMVFNRSYKKHGYCYWGLLGWSQGDLYDAVKALEEEFCASVDCAALKQNPEDQLLQLFTKATKDNGWGGEASVWYNKKYNNDIKFQVFLTQRNGKFVFSKVPHLSVGSEAMND